MMKIIYCFLLLLGSCSTQAQLASPVIDVTNNATGAIIKAVEKVSKVIREDILPFKETISEIQGFFKKSKTVINGVVKNMKLIRQMVELTEKTDRLFEKYHQALQSADDFFQKWKNIQILVGLYGESLKATRLLVFTTQEEQGVMDDEQRILLLKETYQKMLKIYTAMKIHIRRANKEHFRYAKTRREIKAFDNFFN